MLSMIRRGRGETAHLAIILLFPYCRCLEYICIDVSLTNLYITYEIVAGDIFHKHSHFS